jgi:MFS transporter, DHA1 family, multidrug resistance protein
MVTSARLVTSNVENRPLAQLMPLGLQVAVLAALSASGTLATNILLPSLPSIAIAVGVSSAQVTAAITIFLAMFALGQLVVGPMSDRFGRRVPVMIGFAVFFAGSIWCALANDLAALLIGRVVQAGGACATSVLSRAIARDLFEGEKLARVLTFVMVAMAAAPGFSPLVGGALDHFFRLAFSLSSSQSSPQSPLWHILSYSEKLTSRHVPSSIHRRSPRTTGRFRLTAASCFLPRLSASS